MGKTQFIGSMLSCSLKASLLDTHVNSNIFIEVSLNGVPKTVENNDSEMVRV